MSNPTGNNSTPNQKPEGTKFSRRSVLLGTGGGALAGLLVGTGIGTATTQHQATEPATPAHTAPSTGQPVAAAGTTQAGVTRPETPQNHGLIVVADLNPATAATSLAALGNKILELTQTQTSNVLLDGPADLSVLVGVGPRILHTSPHTDLHGLLDMPEYVGDADLPENALGGDLLLSISTSNPGDLEPVLAELQQVLDGFSLRWSQLGFRGPGEAGVARNPLGYHDGVIVPRGEEELATHVWIDSGPLQDGTICVLRTFELNVTAFSQLPADEQDAVMGRKRHTGEPLSGGQLHDEVLLAAKTEEGEFVIPANSHVRAAHPSFTGSDLMLRRSYSYMKNTGDKIAQGLLFTAFQKDINTFIRTQIRMDELDALMDYATVKTTGAFAILPGYSETSPLGSTIF